MILSSPTNQRATGCLRVQGIEQSDFCRRAIFATHRRLDTPLFQGVFSCAPSHESGSRYPDLNC